MTRVHPQKLGVGCLQCGEIPWCLFPLAMKELSKSKADPLPFCLQCPCGDAHLIFYSVLKKKKQQICMDHLWQLQILTHMWRAEAECDVLAGRSGIMISKH